MSLAVRPPVAPMLARLARDLPEGAYRYEPKWDGFRCLAFREGDAVDLRSRHDRPLARYFPEIVAGLLALPDPELALDGEIILASESTRGRFDFAALMSRLHPAASRVERLARESPAAYVAFDLLAVGSQDLRGRGFADRREHLERVLGRATEPIVLTPATRSRDVAADWFDRFRGGGIDGIVAKRDDQPYEPGRRTMVKVKHERTADVVLAGARLLPGERRGARPGRASLEPLVSSLLLGLYDDEDRLRHVGVVTQLPTVMRRELIDELRPLVVPLAEHPWRDGFVIGQSPLGRLRGSAARWTPEMEHDWVPLRPERVLEVGFDQVDGDRFRHPARFKRRRPDRTAASCRLEQIVPEAPDLGEVLRLPLAG